MNTIPVDDPNWDPTYDFLDNILCEEEPEPWMHPDWDPVYDFLDEMDEPEIPIVSAKIQALVEGW